jgi:hypothetical protein
MSLRGGGANTRVAAVSQHLTFRTKRQARIVRSTSSLGWSASWKGNSALSRDVDGILCTLCLRKLRASTATCIKPRGCGTSLANIGARSADVVRLIRGLICRPQQEGFIVELTNSMGCTTSWKRGSAWSWDAVNGLNLTCRDKRSPFIVRSTQSCVVG